MSWLKITLHVMNLAVQQPCNICGTQHIKPIYDHSDYWPYMFHVITPIHDPPCGPIPRLPWSANQRKRLGKFICTISKYVTIWGLKYFSKLIFEERSSMMYATSGVHRTVCNFTGKRILWIVMMTSPMSWRNQVNRIWAYWRKMKSMN